MCCKREVRAEEKAAVFVQKRMTKLEKKIVTSPYILNK
jgi:hypothetical protein